MNMNEPKLRFKADDGSQFPEWKKKKLEDVVEFLDGQRKPLEAGQRVSGKYPYYGASGIIDYVEDYIFDEELILLSEDGANILDRNYRVCFLAKGKYWVNNHAHVLRAMDGNVNGFICEQLETFDYRKYNSGGAQPKLNQATCRAIIMNMPSRPEQQKIAEFLSTIDTVIKKQKETVSAWEERKKGVMQKLFSQEVRFKADDGSDFPEWEEKKLGDISERILVGLATTVTPYYREKGRPMFRNLNIKQGYLDDRDMLFLDDDYADSQKNKAIHFGDILTVHTGNIGWSCLVPEKYEGALSFTTLITTVKFNVVSNKYVCDFLNSPLGMNRMQNLAFSGGRANLNTSEFQKVQVPVPCLAEQQKIADCLSLLDEVIEKQKATLSAWEELKKGLLQQMFV